MRTYEMPVWQRGFGPFNPNSASVVKWLLCKGARKEWASRLAGCNNGRPSDWGSAGRYSDVPAASDEYAAMYLRSEYRKIRRALLELGIDPDGQDEFQLVA
jgi:hypothetical protein